MGTSKVEGDSRSQEAAAKGLYVRFAQSKEVNSSPTFYFLKATGSGGKLQPRVPSREFAGSKLFQCGSMY